MPRNTPLYDEDFAAWAEEQARLLRGGQLSEVDAANIAEEVEDMGRSLRRALRNRLSVLIMHLLKWRYQPGYRSRSWSATIKEQREQIADLLEESPSLKPLLVQNFAKLYRSAITGAMRETGFPETVFPAECPFTPEQILADDFLPEA